MDVHKIFSHYFKDPSVRKAAEVVSRRLEEGHICIYEEDEALQEASLSLINHLSDSPWVGSCDDEAKPFILDGDRLYLQRYWHYESTILHKIERLLSSTLDLNLREISDFILTTATAPDSQLPFPLNVDWQTMAVLHALKYRFTIITGGPGTGKTTSVARILATKLLLHPPIKIAAAAPTGKAAARMNEALIKASQRLQLDDVIRQKIEQIEASTLHRLLGYNPIEGKFRYDTITPLPFDLIVVDEASMMDAALMARLLAATSDEAQIVLLGDRHQLSSVEAGSIFGDLCTSAGPFALPDQNDKSFYREFISGIDQWPIPSIPNATNFLTGHILQLHFSHRFDQTKGIGQFSQLLLSGCTDPDRLIAPYESDVNNTGNLHIVPSLENDRWTIFLQRYTAYAQEKDIATALTKLGEARTLCATHEGPMGTHSLNTLIQDFLQNQGYLGSTKPYYHNQPIQITSNDYNLQLFNGDEGLIRTDPESGALMAWFEGEEGTLRAFPPSILTGFRTAFAMTIHKSQGSEYDSIAVCLPTRAHRILTRELLYTAVTRAKNEVLLISDKEVLIKSVQNPTRRMSGIIPRIQSSNTNSPKSL